MLAAMPVPGPPRPPGPWPVRPRTRRRASSSPRALPPTSAATSPGGPALSIVPPRTICTVPRNARPCLDPEDQFEALMVNRDASQPIRFLRRFDCLESGRHRDIAERAAPAPGTGTCPGTSSASSPNPGQFHAGRRLPAQRTRVRLRAVSRRDAPPCTDRKTPALTFTAGSCRRRLESRSLNPDIHGN